MMTRRSRAIATVTAAVLALTSYSAVPALAAPKSSAPVQASNDNSMEFGARRRYYRHRHAHGAALATAIIGGIATYAAAREYRKARERAWHYRYGYYGAPYYGYYRPRYYWRGW